MKADPEQRNRVSLDDLFALKRAERPDAEFWTEFQRELHVRQRAEAIEPKRWWFALPRVFTQLSRYQMPLGATAVLAVTFLSFRDYREPGFEVVYAAPPVALSTEMAPAEDAITPVVIAETAQLMAEPAGEVLLPTVEITAAPAVTETVTAIPARTTPLSPQVGWAGTPLANELTPSQRSIAAHLAQARADHLPLGRILSEPQVDLTAVVATPAKTINPLQPESSRDQLFVYQGAGNSFGDDAGPAAGRDTHALIARSINQDELYESFSRLSAEVDRLTLKF